MNILEEIVKAFDENGCNGLTIWLDHNKHVQVSLTRDKVGWEIEVSPDAKTSVTKALEKFNDRTRPEQKRKRVPIIRRRRADDLA